MNSNLNQDGAVYTRQEIRKRLSISTVVINGYRPVCEQTLKLFVENGIHRIELSESPGQFNMTNKDSMKYVGYACKSVGINISSYHCSKTTFEDIETEEERQDRVDICRRQIDTLQELKGKVWSSHARIQDKWMASSFEDLMRHIEGTDVVLALENFQREGTHISDRLELIKKLDHPQIGLLIDIGHIREGMDEKGVAINPMTQAGSVSRIIGECGKYIKHLHLHGFKDKDHYAPFEDGDKIEWHELFQSLHGAGYTGDFNFEPVSVPRKSLEYTLKAVGSTPDRMGMAYNI